MRHGFTKHSSFKHRFSMPGLVGLQGSVYFDDDDDPTGGGGQRPPATPTAADTLARYGGDTVRMAERVATLERDNYNVRESRRKDRQTIEELQKKIAPEGAVVLTGDDAKAWEAYKAFGAPAEVSQQLEAGKAAITERDTLKRTTTLETAAKAAGFKPGVLKLLGKDLNIEVREVEVLKEDGTTEKKPTAFAKLKDSAGVESEKPLRDYFKEQGDDVLSSLEAGEGDFSQQQQAVNNGVSYPVQGAGGGKVEYKPTNRYAHNIKKSE